MTLGNQLLASDRIARLRAEADRERLVSTARRHGRPGAAWNVRAGLTLRALLARTVPAGRTPRVRSMSATESPSCCAQSLPAAGHRA